MLKKVAMLFCLAELLTLKVFAAEPGYEEALDYFIVRERNLKPQSKNTNKKASRRSERTSAYENYVLDPQKIFIGVGAGEVFGAQHFSIELGMSFVQNRYFQQSLHFEYLNFDARDFEEYRLGQISNSNGQALFLVHDIQLSSHLFFLSPELSAGVGRVFQEPQEGTLLTLKAGLVYSGHWNSRFLFSAHLYYRRNQHFKRDLHDDGYGLSIRFAF